jgi:hypothetical protein
MYFIDIHEHNLKSINFDYIDTCDIKFGKALLAMGNAMGVYFNADYSADSFTPLFF